MTTGLQTRIGRGIRVLDDRVLVRRDTPAERSRGGIILPDQSKELPDEGTVIALGPGRWVQGEEYYAAGGEGDLVKNRVEPSVSVGDKVVFARTSGVKIRHEGEELTVLHEHEIIAVVEDRPPEFPDDDDNPDHGPDPDDGNFPDYGPECPDCDDASAGPQAVPGPTGV
jgi:chaperonin GroES